MSQDWSSSTVVLYSMAMLLPVNPLAMAVLEKAVQQTAKRVTVCCPTIAVDCEALEFYKCSFL